MNNRIIFLIFLIGCLFSAFLIKPTFGLSENKESKDNSQVPYPISNYASINADVKCICGENVLELKKSYPRCITCDDNESIYGSTYQRLKKMGFRLGMINELISLDQRFSIWWNGDNIGISDYLIDKNLPNCVYDLGYAPCGAKTDETTIERLNDKVYRIYMKDLYISSRLSGTPILHIVDINPSIKKMNVYQASFFLDPTEKNKTEIVSEEEVAYSLHWFWIFRWNGTKWVDISDQKPDFYKTVVLQKLKKECCQEGEDWKKTYDDLVEKAQKGGTAH
jgi:hypothetical protein